jgi:hypothetical protein
MAFENYKGSIKLGAGLTPAAEGYPLMQTSDIQAAEDGTRLDEYLKNLEISGGGGGTNFTTDETLTLSKDGVLSVNTADSAEQDNTLPITSAAVHTQLGNIEILLETI